MDYIDLLSPEYHARMRDRSHRRFWPIAVGVSILFAGLLIYMSYRTLDDLRDSASQLRRESAPLYQRKTQTNKMRVASQEFARKNSLVHRLEHHRPPATLLAVVSAGSRSLENALHVHELRLSRKAQAPKEAPTKKRAKTPPKTVIVYDHEFIIRGTAEDEVAVTKFIDALRTTEVFRSVQLRSTLPSVSTASDRQFEVACVY